MKLAPELQTIVNEPIYNGNSGRSNDKTCINILILWTKHNKVLYLSMDKNISINSYTFPKLNIF